MGGTPGRLPPRIRYEEAILDVAASENEMDSVALLGRAVGDRRTTAERLLTSLNRRRHIQLIELDGRFHTDFRRRDADLDRDLIAAVSGRLTVRLGWGQVFARPCRTAEALGELLVVKRAHPCGPSCVLGEPESPGDIRPPKNVDGRPSLRRAAHQRLNQIRPFWPEPS